jgi:hypothetical protein
MLELMDWWIFHIGSSPSERKWDWGINKTKKKGGFAVPSQPWIHRAPRWKSFVVDSCDSPRLRLALALPVLFSSTAQPGTDGAGVRNDDVRHD